MRLTARPIPVLAAGFLLLALAPSPAGDLRGFTAESAKAQREWETKFLSSQQYAGKVCAFEGAEYEPRGLYRPEIDCIMFTRDEVGFCRVCRRAIERMLAIG